MEMRALIDVITESTIAGAAWYRLADEFSLEADCQYLFHGTSSALVDKIIDEGMGEPNHWGSREVASFFARGTCEDHGGKPVLFRLALTRFDQHGFAPDEQMIDFPIFADYDERWIAWEESEQTWVDSLRIYEAVEYHRPAYLERADLVG